MKKIVALLLLAVLLLGCGPQASGYPGSTTPEGADGAAQESGTAAPSSQQIAAVKQEMADWAEGRWTEHAAVWSAESGTLTLSATAAPGADETAVKAYCRILDDIASKHMPEVKLSAAVYFPSGAKIQCK